MLYRLTACGDSYLDAGICVDVGEAAGLRRTSLGRMFYPRSIIVLLGFYLCSKQNPSILVGQGRLDLSGGRANRIESNRIERMRRNTQFCMKVRANVE